MGQEKAFELTGGESIMLLHIFHSDIYLPQPEPAHYILKRYSGKIFAL